MLRSAGSHTRALLRRGGLVRSLCFGTVSPEQQLEDKLRGSIDGVQSVKVSHVMFMRHWLPTAAELAHWAAQVTDTSGGCGTMYDVNITADAFRHA